MKNNAYIIAAKRTAVIPKGGAFRKIRIHELAAPVISDLLRESKISKDYVDELILSNAVGGGGNPARPTSIASNLPKHIGGYTIDRQCTGGLDAVWLAAQMIQSGTHDIIIAGGSESASCRPIRMAIDHNTGKSISYDRPIFTGIKNRDPNMLDSIAEISCEMNISKEDQEAWAINSHKKALHADFNNEIINLNNQLKDTFTRKLNKNICERAPILKGNITTATTAVDSDAAAFCLIVSEKIAKKYPNAVKIVYGISSAGTPDAPALATIDAVRKILKMTKIRIDSLTAIEIMEAYSAQAIIAANEFKFNREFINIGGGALARGHAIGASGAILAVRLFHELQKAGGNGLATIAAAGGLGSALILSSLRPR